MSKKVKLSLLLLLLSGFLITLLVSLMVEPDKSNQALKGASFPEFTLPRLQKPELQVSQRIFNQQSWTIVNVWASWCAVCLKEHDFLQQLAQQGLFIVGLNYRDGITSAAQYLADNGNPYQVTLYDADSRLSMGLGVIGTPETILVDSKGVIRQRHLGELNQSVWQAKFAPYTQGSIQ